MNTSYIAIKGNHISNTDAVFRYFNYQDLNKDQLFQNADEFYTYITHKYFEFSEQEIILRGIWISNGWTIIADPEMVDSIDEEALSVLSGEFQVDVLTFLIQSASACYGFSKYTPQKKRHFFVVDGTLTRSVGDPLPEEKNLPASEKITGENIIDLAINLGIDFDAKGVDKLTIKQFFYSENSNDAPPVNLNTESAKKTWWKVW